MSRQVKLLRWKVANAGVLGERSVEVGPLGAGVNVISGPNESGKSTMVRALRVALFDRWNFTGKDVKDLQAHGTRVAPRVEIDFEVDGVVHRLTKQLLLKPSARLVVGDDPRVLEQGDVDERLRSLFGSHEGNRQGASVDDMGLWGLLWVQQDEFATKEPAESMGQRVRGDLSSMVDRQVGRVMGGADGVRLKGAIDTEFERFYTPKQKDRPAREFAAAEQKTEALRASVEQRRKDLRETEQLSAAIQDLESSLRDMDLREAELLAELRDAEAGLLASKALAEETAAAEVTAREASEALTRWEAQASRRALQQQALEASESDARVQGEALQALRAQREQARADHAEAVRVREAALHSRDERRRQADRVAAAIERLRLDVDVAQKTSDLEDARRWAAAQRTAEDELRRLPDAVRLREAEGLATSCDKHRALAERSATRLTLQRPGEDPRVEPVTRQRTLDLGSLGSIEIDPPRGGFLQRRALWREGRDELRQALARHGETTVGALRVRAETDAQRQRELDACVRELAKVAPQGIDPLQQEWTRADREHRDAARTLAEARELQANLVALDAELVTLALDRDQERALREAHANLERLRAQTAGAGVRVRIRSHAATRVQLGALDTPRLVTPGHEVARVLTEPMTVVIDDRVEIEIDPGAVASQAAEQRRLADEVEQGFVHAGVATLGELDEKVALLRRKEGTREGLAARLTGLCPKGVAVLAERVDRLLHLVTSLAARLEQGRQLTTVQASLIAGPAPITGEAWEATDALDRKVLTLETEVRRSAGRLLRVEGPLAAAWPSGTELIDDLGALVEGAHLALIPGEAVSDLELPMLEQQLRRALGQWECGSLDELRARHTRHAELTEQCRSYAASMARVAPAGLAALESDLVALTSSRARLAAGEAESADALPMLRGRWDELAREIDDAESQLRVAEEVMARRACELAAWSTQLDSTEAAQVERDIEARSLKQSLEAERTTSSDGALAARVAEAQAAARREGERWESARRRAEELGMERQREEVAHWERLLDGHRKQRSSAKDESHRKAGELDMMRRQGRYDLLMEESLALDVDERRLAEMREQAEAVRLLRQLAVEEYGKAEDRLLTPVYQESGRLLNLLWKDSSFNLERDTWRVKSVNRAGVSEDFDVLSGGAKEQLSVIVRIALAQVLAKERAAMPLILDDILGWTDDGRLKQMVRVLEVAAQEMQVIVLTCHPTRFARFLGAPQFQMEAMKLSGDAAG